jgi:hypothetical protein
MEFGQCSHAGSKAALFAAQIGGKAAGAGKQTAYPGGRAVKDSRNSVEA